MYYGVSEDRGGMKQILMVAAYNFRTWRKNPRIILSFAIAFIFCFLLSNKVVMFADKYETSMQILEPFIWTFGDSNSILLSSSILIFLFADMPFLNSGTPFFLVRTTRRRWLIGQAVYVILTTFLYLLFVMVSTSFLCMKNAFIGNVWSSTAVMLGYSKAGEVIAVPATVKTMEMSTPYQCAAIIFLLMLFYALLLVFLMLLFNLLRGQIGGVFAAFTFSIYGFLLNPATIKLVFHISDYETYRANVIVGWLSPLNHATFSMHNFGYDLLPSLRQSYLIGGILLCSCFFAALWVIQRYSFHFTGTEGEK